jgi:hypothetical protein
VALSAPSAGDFCCSANMDGDERALQFRDFEDTRRIGAKLQRESTGGLAVGEDSRQTCFRWDRAGLQWTHLSLYARKQAVVPFR